MRTFEIILLILVTVLPFVKRKLPDSFRANYLLIAIGLTLVFHLALEGWRWQMFPAYLLLLILAWRIKVMDLSEPVKLTFLRVLGFAGILIVAAIGWLLPIILPVFSLPAPNGPYRVGTESIHVQTEQDEPITKDPNDKRQLILKVWYPSTADVSSLQSEPYVGKSSRSGFAMKYGLPANALNYLDRVETFAFAGIPVADNSFPVLVFSHGYGSKATGYYSLLTEIASQGYIVINMNHTYESLGATFPDGSTAFFDYKFQRKISADGMLAMGPLIAAFKNNVPFEERHPIIQKAVKGFYESQSVDRWANDIVTVIDLLEVWNMNGFLKDKLDLNKIGVFGHSNGGGAAGQAGLIDPRVKAAANLDGITWGNLIDTAYTIPFLYVSADWPAEHEDINSHIYINKSTDYFYETKVLTSGHPNFMDIPFMIPVNSLAGTGEIDPYQGMEIINGLVTTFFDKHLKNKPEAKLQYLEAKYDLLEMKIHLGDSIK